MSTLPHLLSIWQFIGPLALEAALAVMIVGALAFVVRSVFWRRTLWQVCLAALLVLTVVECTGVVRPIVGHFWVKLGSSHSESNASRAGELMPALVARSGSRPQFAVQPKNEGIGPSLDEAQASAVGASAQQYVQEPAKRFLAENPAFLSAALPRMDVWPGSAGISEPEGVSDRTVISLWLFWIAGSSFCLLWLGISQTVLLMIYWKSVPVADAGSAEIVAKLVEQLGIRRSVRVIECERLKTPVAFGVLRPTIGLPKGFTATFDLRQREAMLAHELAHLAVNDPAWQILSTLAAALIWWHPLVWWARRQWHLASECAADEASVLVAGGPDALAECLLRFGKQISALPALGRLAINGDGFRSSLGQRVARLFEMREKVLDPPKRFPRMLMQLLGPAGLTAAIVSGTAWASPKIFATEELNKGDTIMKTIHQSWQRSLFAVTLAAALGSKPGPILADDAAKQDVAPATPPTSAAVVQTPNASSDRVPNPGPQYRLPPEIAKRYGLRPGSIPVLAANPADDSKSQPAQTENREDETGDIPKTLIMDWAFAARYGLLPPGINALDPAQIDRANEYQKVLRDLASERNQQRRLRTKYNDESPRMKAVQVRIQDLLDKKHKFEAENPNLFAATPQIAPLAGPAPQPAEVENLEEQASEAAQPYPMDPILMQRYGMLPPGMALPTNSMMKSGSPAKAAKGRQAVRAKLEEATLADVVYNGIPLSEIVKDLSAEARRHDPKKRGINFLINSFSREAGPAGVDPTTGAPLPPQHTDIGTAVIRMNLPLKDVRLIDVLDVIKKVSEVPIRYTIEDYGVVFSPAPAQPLGQMISRTFKVDAATLTQGLENVAGLSVDRNPARRETQSQQVTELLRQFLSSAGVTIDSPNQVFYNDRTGILMVRISDQEQDIVQAAIEMLSGRKETASDDANVTGAQARGRYVSSNRDQTNADAKLLIEMGRLDEAEHKSKELLRFEPNDQAAQESLQRIQEIRARQGGRIREKGKESGAVESVPMRNAVSVFGKVMKPGTVSIPEEERMDIIQALAQAGGFQPTANENKIAFSRNGQTTIYRFKDLVKISDESRKVWLEPGDVVEVKESTF